MQDHSVEASSRCAWRTVTIAAVLITALNVAKPVHIDESVFVMYAEEFAKHPVDPYDFEFAVPTKGSANLALCPPVVPYWLALGMQVVGSEPIALRCWMFPVALLFAWGVDFFAARFAQSMRKPVFWLCVFSPCVVPSFSFMLDVPMLALCFAALALAMRAIEKNSWGLTAGAAIVAGIAIETKYNGVVACGAILLWCFFKRQPLRGLAVCAGAVAIFLGWESYLVLRHGESHFVLQMKIRQAGTFRRFGHLVMPLVSQVAGLAAAPALLAFAAFGRRKKTLVAVGAVVVVGVIVHYFFPSQSGLFPRSNGKPSVTVSTLTYGLAAIPVWLAVFSVNSRLIRRGIAPGNDQRLYDWFLPLWMLIEVVACFLLSPFAAARRVFGIILVFTFGAGRLAHYGQTSPRVAWSSAAFGGAMALLFCYVNQLDAEAGRNAARQAAAEIASLEKDPRFASDDEPTRVFGYDRCGPTGVTYYMHRAGWTLMPPKAYYQPRRGDLIVVSDPETNSVDGLHDFPEHKFERVAQLTSGDDFPLRLALRYYAGGFPLEHQEGTRFRVQIFRMLGDDPAAHESPASKAVPLQADERSTKQANRPA